MNKLNHVAFIMDGNGRWGKKRYKGRNFGHLKGVEVVKKIVKNSIKLKIPIVTFYVFSSENWKRPKKEISFLFNLIKSYFTKEIENLVSQGIKINILGEINKLSSDIKLTLKKTINLTKKNKKIMMLTGGSMVSEKQTFDFVLNNFFTIWIKAQPREHMNRVIKQGDLRPMASNPKAMDDLHNILKERKHLYNLADITLSTENKSENRSYKDLIKIIEN